MDTRTLDLVRDLDRHVSRDGWSQPPRLFALVPAEQTTGDPAAAGRLSAVEQAWDSDGEDLIGDLDRIEWPETVLGAAVSVERLLENGQQLRLTAAVLRDRSTEVALRYADHDTDDEVGFGQNLAPELQAALLGGLEPRGA